MRQLIVRVGLIMVAVFAVASSYTPANAAVVTWDLDATFSDGGQAMGSFQFDSAKFAATGNGLGDFDILTTNGSVLAGTDYLTGFFISSAGATPTSIDITNSLGHLNLQHTIPLTDAGGTITLTGGSEAFGALGTRTVVSGELVARVPEPTPLAIAAVGALSLLGALRRRRRAAQ